MDCRFTSEGGGPPEFYAGTMSTLGVDLGFTSEGALAWGVFAPTNQMMPDPPPTSMRAARAAVHKPVLDAFTSSRREWLTDTFVLAPPCGRG
jgi:hypothetical protein